MSKARLRWKRFVYFTLDRLSEQGTWQGIGFLVAALGSKFGAGLDWGQAAALGGALSAFMKMIFPEPKK